MIIQYLSKLEDGKNIETIEDEVVGADVSKDEVRVHKREKGTTIFPKNHKQIYQMWLLNDDFKTLKRLI